MNRSSLTLALAAALIGVSGASAQSVTTDPVGFTTLTIKGSSFSVLGLNMVKPVSYQGVVSAVSGSTLTDSNANFTTALTAGKKYFVEVISGDYAGLNAEITAFSGNTITIDGDVSTIAAALNGAGHRIRESWVLSDIFGASNSAGLQGGTSASGADLIYSYNPTTAAFTTYYYKTGGIGGIGWRSLASPSVDRSADVLYFTDSIIVERRGATDISVKLVGAVKTGRTIVPIFPGVNMVGNVYPVTDITLANSGLFSATANSLTGGTSSAAADLVYILSGGTFTTYYYKTGGIGGIGWRSLSSPSTDTGSTSIAIGTGAVIQRRGSTATNVVLVPTF